MLPIAILALIACSGSDSGDYSDDTDAGCPPVAVVTDIDETLTTDDDEFLSQITDPSYDPAMRPDGNTLLQGYADLGYAIVYLTGRGEKLELSDGTSARDATQAWLDAHGFPAGDLYLYSEYTASGDTARDYKSGVLADLAATGETFAYAYGNAEADIQAYETQPIPKEDIFLVGDLAGTMDVTGITNEDAYTAHEASFLPTVPHAPQCE